MHHPAPDSRRRCDSDDGGDASAEAGQSKMQNANTKLQDGGPDGGAGGQGRPAFEIADWGLRFGEMRTAEWRVWSSG